jgi:hypothetical protein
MNAIIEYHLSEIVEPITRSRSKHLINECIVEMAKILQHSHLNTKLNAKSYDTFESIMNSLGAPWYYFGLKKVRFNNLIYTQTDPFEITQYFHYLFAYSNIEFTDQMKGTLQALLIIWRHQNPQYNDSPIKYANKNSVKNPVIFYSN